MIYPQRASGAGSAPLVAIIAIWVQKKNAPIQLTSWKFSRSHALAWECLFDAPASRVLEKIQI
jgi:hypothetical protein